jgi:hypothetical protein
VLKIRWISASRPELIVLTDHVGQKTFQSSVFSPPCCVLFFSIMHDSHDSSLNVIGNVKMHAEVTSESLYTIENFDSDWTLSYSWFVLSCFPVSR